MTGKVQVCNSRYGSNGWLGVAQIWASGSHITKGTVKLNDTYYQTATYNTPAWRALVMCQEIGHTFGLGHQDENFINANLGSCMDYTNDPDGGAGGASSNDPSNDHPNPHDFTQLEIIYEHLDSTTTVGQATGSALAPPAMDQIDFEGPGQWGRRVRYTHGGRTELYELDFGGGNKIVTHVIWADGPRGRR